MYYQIENLTHQIIDVVEDENWVCIFKSRLLRCPASIADGIIGSDNDTIYHLAGRPECGTGDYYVTPIDAETYANLYDQLELGEVITIEEPTSDQPVQEEPPQELPQEEPVILSRAELTEKISELEEQNQMLLECLMEMSEIVYA